MLRTEHYTCTRVLLAVTGRAGSRLLGGRASGGGCDVLTPAGGCDVLTPGTPAAGCDVLTPGGCDVLTPAGACDVLTPGGA